jgi:hypothetical protein
MSGGGKRDIVRFEANERVDLPDLNAVQANARSETRVGPHTILLGQGTNEWGAAGSKAVTYNKAYPDRALIRAFTLSRASTQITITAGLGVGSILDPAGVAEHGVLFGGDGSASQTIDVGAYPNGTYDIRVKPTFTSGIPGSRIFWDAALPSEVAASVDTRKVFGWTTTTALSSAPDDGVSIVVGTVIVSGGAITALTEHGGHLFDQHYTRNVLTGAYTYLDEWFYETAVSTPTLRAQSRSASNPVVSLADFAGIVRAQVANIIEVAGYWRADLPATTTTNTTGAIGTSVSLKVTRDHIDLSTNPHGPNLTQTGTLTVNGEATFADNIVLTGSGTDRWPRLSSTLTGSVALTQRIILGQQFSLVSPDPDSPGYYFFDDASGGVFLYRGSAVTGTVAYDLAHPFSQNSVIGSNLYANQVMLYFQEPLMMAAGDTVASASTVLYIALRKTSLAVPATSAILTATLTMADLTALAAGMYTYTLNLASLSDADRSLSYVDSYYLTVRLENHLTTTLGNTSDYSLRFRGARVTMAHHYMLPA